MHLDLIVGRVPANGWATVGKWRGLRLSLCVQPSLPFHLSVLPPPRVHTHTHTRTQDPARSPPPPQQEVQPWIPAGVPNSNQSSGTARGGGSPPSLLILAPSPSLSLSGSGSVDCSHLPPQVLSTRAHTHTKTHLDDTRAGAHPPPSSPVLRSQGLSGAL